MVFSSNLFLFLFFPVCLLFYLSTPSKWKNHILLVFSSFFYFWSSGSFLFNLYGTIILNYFLGQWIHHSPFPRSKMLLVTGISINLLHLFIYKYLNFFFYQLSDFVSSFGILLPSIPKIALPVGISFFTFQAISYLVEIYQGKELPAQSWVDFGLFIGCFPHLVAGPVVRYSDVSKELKKRQVTLDLVFEGAFRFTLGLAKKVIIANTLAQVADAIYDLPQSEVSLTTAWIGNLAYTFQILFDFSGYSDMAIGLARIFGFYFPENFNQPYHASNMTQFWRRWHMSLSRWFRDFLYIPLGGNRASSAKTYFNLFLVFMLCGFWHGAAWTFLIWGIYHGLLLVFERWLKQKFDIEFVGFFGQIYMMLFVIIGWVFFRSVSFNQALFMLKKMFFFWNPESLGFTPYTAKFYLKNNILTFFALAGLFSLSSIEWIKNTFLPKNLINLTWLQGWLSIILGILSASYLAKGSYNPFIYFRF